MNKTVKSLLFISLLMSLSGCSKNPVSIIDAYVNDANELVLVYSDGTEKNVGTVKGDKGDKGDQGDKGDKGDDGKTPYIGENGNWWIGDIDTGVPAGSTAKISSISVQTTNSSFEYYVPNERLGIKVFANYDNGMMMELSPDRYVIEDNLAFKNIGSYVTTVKLAGNEAINTTLNYDVVPRKNFKILFIGNSFSQNTVNQMPNVSKTLGMNVEAVNMYVAGCTIDTHYSNLKNNTAAYRKETYVNNSWKYESEYKLADVIASEKWDYISFQQASNYSGIESSYSNLYNLVNLVKENLNNEAKDYTQFVFNMTWAYQHNVGELTPSYGPIFENNYHSDQEYMYNSIVSCAKKLNRDVFDIVIPNGTAVQNMRASYMGDTITSDGFHLYNNHGQYLLGVNTVKALSGIDVDSLVTPTSDPTKIIAVEASNNAFKKPYEVTPCTYAPEEEEEPGEFNPDNYTLKEITFTNGKYYFNKENPASTLLSWDRFICTQVFQKSDFPNGSVIYIEDGYQYRADGWTDSTVPYTGARRNNVTEQYVTINNSWWDDFNYVGFNISRVDGTSLSSNYSAAQNAFKIYIPKK